MIPASIEGECRRINKQNKLQPYQAGEASQVEDRRNKTLFELFSLFKKL